MLEEVDERRMSRKFNVKVRPHKGACIRDMYDHLNALLRKKPTYLILHVGTNDASKESTTSDMVYDELIHLKDYAESKVPGMKVIISCPVVRSDNKLANMKILHVRNKLKRDGIKIINNENVTYDHLGRRGLHLNRKGTSRLAMNMIACIQRL